MEGYNLKNMTESCEVFSEASRTSPGIKGYSKILEDITEYCGTLYSIMGPSGKFLNIPEPPETLWKRLDYYRTFLNYSGKFQNVPWNSGIF